MRPCFLFPTAAFISLLTARLSAQDQQFLITKIADTNTLIPGSTETFDTLGGPIISDGVIAFWGRGPASGGLSEWGIFTPSGGSLRPLVGSHTTIPGTTDIFSSFTWFSLDGHDLAFVGHGATSGIYLLRDDSITTLVDLDTPVPGIPGATFREFQGNSGISLDGGVVAFSGSGTLPARFLPHDHYRNPTRPI